MGLECQGKPLACIYHKDCGADYVAIESLFGQPIIAFRKGEIANE